MMRLDDKDFIDRMSALLKASVNVIELTANDDKDDHPIKINFFTNKYSLIHLIFSHVNNTFVLLNFHCLFHSHKQNISNCYTIKYFQLPVVSIQFISEMCVFLTKK